MPKSAAIASMRSGIVSLSENETVKTFGTIEPSVRLTFRFEATDAQPLPG